MIRKASKKEFLKVLRHPSVRCRLSVYPDKIRSKNNYVVENSGCRLYFMFYDIGDGNAEWHPVAKRKDRTKARQLIEKSLQFMKGKGFKRVVTYIPDSFNGTKKLALNMGFSELFSQSGNVYFARAL